MGRLEHRWVVGLDDLTGRWCVFLEGEAPTIDGSRVVGDFAEQETAEHVAALHNVSLG